MLKLISKDLITKLLEQENRGCNIYFLIRALTIEKEKATKESESISEFIISTLYELSNSPQASVIAIKNTIVLVTNSFKRRLELGLQLKPFASLLKPDLFGYAANLIESNKKADDFLNYLNTLIELIVFRDCGNLLESIDPLYAASTFRPEGSSLSEAEGEGCKKTKIIIEYEPIIADQEVNDLKQQSLKLLDTIIKHPSKIKKEVYEQWKYIHNMAHFNDKQYNEIIYVKDIMSHAIVLLS